MSHESPPDKAFLVGGTVDDKFVKLNQEYLRIKSQNQILKKAVIQEQQKSAGLEKELRETEQRLRQHTEETDILQFNNQRLTKRITVLQEELATKKDSGSWWGSNKKNEELDILRNELETKIRENAELHLQVSDLKEELRQAKELHVDQADVLRACVVAKEEEVDEVKAEVKKVTDSLNQIRAELEKQQNYMKESEEQLMREVQHIVVEITQSRKRYKQRIMNPNAAPSSPLAVWRDNKHTRELIGTFKDLHYAVETHWDTQMDKISLLRSLRPPEQLDLIYKELASTIPSLSTQMTHIADSLHQYLPVLFSKEALPNIEFADTLHRFVNTCKKYLSYQQLRHVEHSQQGGRPRAGPHATLADVHGQVLKSLDRLIADREVSAIRSLCGILNTLTSNSKAVYELENEQAEGDDGEELIEVNERLLSTQDRIVVLLESFATKLDEYESLAGSGRAVSEGEESHRLREIASHLIMLNNDINVANKERELQVMSVNKDVDSLRAYIRELQDTIAKKEGQLAIVTEEWSSSKEQIRQLNQHLEVLRRQLSDQELTYKDKFALQEELHAEKLAEQQLELERIHSKALQDSEGALRSQISSLQLQLQKETQKVETLQEELLEKVDHIAELEEEARREKEKWEEFEKMAESQGDREKAVQMKHVADIQQLQDKVEERTRKVADLQQELSEKQQLVKTLQQKLMQQEQRLEEKGRQVLAAEKMAADKDQLIKSIRHSNELNGSAPRDHDSALQFSADSDMTRAETDSVDLASTPTRLDETPPPTPPTPAANSARYNMTVVDEAGNQSNGLNASTLDKEREQSLKEYYEARMLQLAAQSKSADNKAVQLFEQYSSLLHSLDEKEAERNSLLEKIKEAQDEVKTGKDDLESTRNNYDVQLRLMSDHILELGEKIMKLEAEFGQAKACKVACGKCKTWNTVEWLMTEGRGGQRCVKGNHPLSTFAM